LKRLPTPGEIYRGIRKPVPAPTKVEGDKRQKIRRREDRRQMEEQKRRGPGSGAEEDG